MGKLKLIPDATFTATVGVPLHGGGTAEVVFTFRHRTREDMKAFIAQEGRLIPDMVMDAATDWDLAEPFTRENVEKLDNNYMGAGQAIYETYLEAHTKAREKN